MMCRSPFSISSLHDFLVDYFGIDKNTSATIIITIFVFGAGIFTSLMVDFFKTWYRRRMLQEVLKLDFAKSLNKQGNIFAETAAQFNFDRQGPMEISRVEISQISSIKEIGYDQSFQAFFYGIYNLALFGRRKLKLKSFNKLWDSISAISYWHEKAVKEFDSYIEQSNVYNQRRNTAIDGYRKLIEEVFASVNGNRVPPPLATYLASIDAIHVIWQGLPNRTLPHIVQRKLVLPIRILNRKHQNLPIVNNINTYLLEASIHYENQRVRQTGSVFVL
jgi:hypothetical protein